MARTAQIQVRVGDQETEGQVLARERMQMGTRMQVQAHHGGEQLLPNREVPEPEGQKTDTVPECQP